VRLSGDEPFDAIRARLSAAGIEAPIVVEARQILDEGDPSDLSPVFDDVRLARVAARLRIAGVQVDAIVTTGARRVRSRDFVVAPVERVDQLAEAIGHAPTLAVRRDDLRAARLDLAACAPAVEGHRVRAQLDNHLARSQLIALIDGARVRVHVQVYITSDDADLAPIEQAIVRAAERGVRVRLLADSLLSGHGSFGATNSLLDRLSRQPGIDVRPIAPIVGVPSIEQLKQRDHRKLIVVDGAVAIVTGRNLGRAYYVGFDEVALRADSPWQEVPWFDAGVQLEGPAVETIEAAFLETWLATAGEAYALSTVARAGDAGVRVVVHHGLEDAYTLEAYLALIDAARERLLIVNCFPLQLELQGVLRRALRRGVRVRVLIGNVRPLHGQGIPFVGGAVRDFATELVQSRLDPLIDEGAEVFELGLAPLRGWDAALDPVRPHVHAKVLIADGEIATIGSANLDLTAAYWESEALVVIEEAGFVRDLEAQVEALLVSSPRVTSDDPRRLEHATRREWLAKHWPTGVLG
ncbi:MAG: phosphatidylserine/phosphatidylglycerophosphate/cardiolipin synthase family protein, partial [Polyangiales bacterium]